MTPRTRYNAVAMALHWTIAALIIGNIGLGFWFAWLEETPLAVGALAGEGLSKLLRHWPRSELVWVHAAIGMSILLLSLGRLGWGLVNPPPSQRAGMHRGERALARTVHLAFYGFMIGMPLVGWALVSSTPRYARSPFSFFGLVLPSFPGVPTGSRNAAHELLVTLHADYLPWLFYALLALHVAGALKHQWVDRDGELGRMIPWLREPGPRAGARTSFNSAR